MKGKPNILLITADQWRGDCLGTVGHPVVKTPNLDAFAEEATVFERHYATCAPCSPARASLYTGLYQMNHRVVWNGAPLDSRFDNIARAARRAGYDPTLFGYTDTSPDPRIHDPNDPALSTYEGVLPGFAVRQFLPEDDKPWLSWLASKGHDPETFPTIHHVAPEEGQRISREPPAYGAEDTQTAFLTDAFLSWLGEQEPEQPWFAHISYLRPHPPITVPEPYNRMYDPEDGPEFFGAASPEEEGDLHPLVRTALATQKVSGHIPGADGLVKNLTRDDFRRIRALYYGMISEVDAQIGRLLSGLSAADADKDTLVIFTSDHAEMMGDHWMLGKGGFFEQSYHIPLMIRAPGRAKANRVTAFTSAADIFPTLADFLDIEPGHAPDGASLLSFLDAQTPARWRKAAIFEFDYRNVPAAGAILPEEADGRDRTLLAMRGPNWQYVHFPELPPLLLKPHGPGQALTDLSNDPEMQPVLRDCLSDLLSLRMRHNDDTLARKLVWDYYS